LVQFDFHVEHAARQIERLDWLSTNLLELSKLDSGLIALDLRPAMLDDLGLVPALVWLFERYTAQTKGLHPRSLSEQSWQAVRRMPWTPERDRELDADFARRYEGTSILAQLNRGWTREQSRAEIVRRVGLDPDRKTAVVFSHILWDANMFYGEDLFADPSLSSFFKSAWNEARGTLRLVVQIDPEDRELNALRWETLYHDGLYLARDANRPFSRLLESRDWTRVSPRPKGALRALAVAVWRKASASRLRPLVRSLSTSIRWSCSTRSGPGGFSWTAWATSCCSCAARPLIFPSRSLSLIPVALRAAFRSLPI